MYVISILVCHVTCRLYRGFHWDMKKSLPVANCCGIMSIGVQHVLWAQTLCSYWIFIYLYLLLSILLCWCSVICDTVYFYV